MPGSKLRETQKPTAAIRQRTLNVRLRLNLISRLVTQSQSCEWLPKLQNPRRNQYKPSHIIWVYKLYGSQTVLFIANQNWSRELILICTCSIICDIQSIVKTGSIDFSLSELLMLLFTPFSVTSLWKTTETKPSRYTAQCISYSLQFSWSVSEKSFPQSTSPTLWDSQLTKRLFQTRSNTDSEPWNLSLLPVSGLSWQYPVSYHTVFFLLQGQSPLLPGSG